MRRTLPTSVGLAVLLIVMLASTAVAATVIRVDEDGEGGWLFNRDASTSTPYEFSLDAASIGEGSLYVLPIENDGNGNSDKFIAEQFLGVEVGDVSQISYDFLIEAPDASAANHFYLNVYTNFPDSPRDNFYDCRFDFVPGSGSTIDFTTMTVDATDAASTVGGGSDCPDTLANMPDGSWLRVFSINVGDTSGNDTGVGGYLDNVTVTVAGETTTWDFEVPAQVKEDCKDGGWETYGFSNQGECVSALQANPNAGK